MFESLTLEQIDNVKKTITTIKNKRYKYNHYIYDASTMIDIISYKCIVELKKQNIKITSDIENAAKVFTAFPMTDSEFLKIKKYCNDDFEKIGNLYSVNAIYAKSRYKLLLIRKQHMLKKIQQNTKENDFHKLKNKRVFSKDDMNPVSWT